jgi:hypothetical protein
MAPQSAVNLWPNNKKAFCPFDPGPTHAKAHTNACQEFWLSVFERGVAYDVPILVSEAPG